MRGMLNPAKATVRIRLKQPLDDSKQGHVAIRLRVERLLIDTWCDILIQIAGQRFSQHPNAFYAGEMDQRTIDGT